MATATDKEVLSEFECPICKEYMHPPIRMCYTGHSFCDECFSKISTCSICKGAKITARCFVLEKIHEKFNFPCKHSQNGCPQAFNGNDMVDHIIMCDYRNITCPIDKNCKWKNRISDLENHAQTDHKRSYYQNGGETHCKMTSQTYSLWIQREQNEIFLFHRKPTKNNMDFTVFHFGRSLIAKEFIFKIFISDDIILQGPCLPSYLYYQEDKTLGVMIPIDQLKLCANDTDWKFTLEIIKKS